MKNEGLTILIIILLSFVVFCGGCCCCAGSIELVAITSEIEEEMQYEEDNEINDVIIDEDAKYL